jgi:hypothetical protein
MYRTISLFYLTVLFSYVSMHSQTIDELIDNSYDLDATAQYQLGMLFYGVKLEPEPNPKTESLIAYYKANYAASSRRELDSLDIQLYKEWLNDSYVDNINQSANKGHDKAQLQLGKYYESLDEYGAKIRAYKWYASSAAQHNTEAINWIHQKNEERYLKQYIEEDDYKNIDFYVALFDLSNTLCYHVNKGAFNKTLDTRIENELLEFLNITKEDAAYKTKLVDFWNSYNKFFICFDNGSDIPEHILKRSLNELFYQHNQILFNWLFELDKTKKIDFNQVIYFDGHPETLLDFLSTILLNSYEYQQFDMNAISELRLKLIEYFNAKTASELKD